jgi:hypothetical protein
MVVTRSQKSKDLLSLPNYDEPIIVSCSDIYSAIHHDLFSCIMETKHKNDEHFQENKQKVIYNLSQKSRELSSFFLQKVNSVVTNASLRPYMGWHYYGVDLKPFFDKFCLYIHKYCFFNKQSHVEGTIDALYHRDLWNNDFLNISSLVSEKDYVVLYYCKDVNKIDHYHKTKALAQLYYFGKMYGVFVETQKLVLVDKSSYKILEITQQDIDAIQSMVRDIRKAKKIGDTIDLQDISNPKYFPNMKIQDSLLQSIKKKYAFEWGEITSLWWCSDIHRQKMIEQGIYSWRDPRFTPQLLATFDSRWNSSEKQRILNRILQTNRQDSSSPDFQWIIFEDAFPMEIKSKCIFIDFEYLSNMNDLLYMIGVYIPETGYKVFWAKDLTTESEKDLINEFYDFITELQDTTIWYWYADKTKWQKRCHIHDLTLQCKSADIWEDLCELMTQGISVYGATNYKLKSIVKAFSDHGKIPFSYSDLDCQDGLESIEFAMNYFKTRLESDKVSLEKYNQLDCEAQFHIFKTVLEEKK